MIAALDTLIYLAALKFNIYYRRKIVLHKIPLPKILRKGPSHTVPAAEKRLAINPAAESNVSAADEQLALPCISNAAEKSGAVIPVRKFHVEERVEFFGSKGEITGSIMSCNGNNSKSEYRYLVNWGKDGIWWAAEDQIERSERRKVEVHV